MSTYNYSQTATTIFDAAGATTVNGVTTYTAGHNAVVSTADIFNFDDESITAASLAITGSTTAIITGAKTYTLTNFDIKKISSTNFIFADGSKLQIGDGTSSTTNDDVDNIILGTDYNDYFDGLLNSAAGDTISYATATSGVTIDLATGVTAGGAGVDKLANIENAIGSAFSDTLIAKATGSKLDGGGGMDILTGGAGNDTFVITAGDTVTGAAGTDLVISSVDYTLPSDVENLTLAGSSFQGVGNALANTLTGNSGNNVLDGGTGNDIMIGGAGNDTYLVDSSTDTVTEVAGSGTTPVLQASATGVDIVYSTADFTLGSNVENLRLMGATAINGTGNTLNNIIYANSGDNSVDGGSGTDTLSYQYGATAGVSVSLTASGAQATTGSGSDTISNFDNLTGSRYSDSLTGTSGNNVLTGGMGNDTLTSLAGVDTLDGGTGNDTYVVSTTTSKTFVDSAGIDTLQSGGTATIANFSFLENLTLTAAGSGTGNSGNNTLTSTITSGATTLDGGAGSDILKGGTGTSTDTLKGGLGNDTYLITSASGETITELDGGGTDLVITTVSGLTLAANVENLTVGTATINASTGALSAITAGTTGVTVTGNISNNVITGGTGADTMNGGIGNDTLISGDGTLASGNFGADRLDGGAGNDAMTGGAGDDTYVVDSTTDTVTEVAGTAAQVSASAASDTVATYNGTDTVESSITYTLGSNVENLTLVTGSGDINGTGNTLDNVITGNATANTLNGSTGADTLNGGAGDDILNGGTGSDSMSGGADNDTYVVDASGDTVTEAATEGTDTVQSSVTYTITDADVENLTLTGTSVINGTGNASANTLTGNTANNTLVGNGGADSFIGGAGKDILTGGAGIDTFIYNAASESTTSNFDVITNFKTAGADKIDVSAIFGGTSATLRALDAAFSGSGPEITHTNAGLVSFDVDGNGTADFAISLTGAPTIVIGDFAF
ncbi:MAG: calcium-binding protein [Methylobacter sp.]|nr:MAG: calcium-binding protein [Methylobacter sp.]